MEKKNAEARRALLRERIQSHILILDGAMGTAIQGLGLTGADFGGEHLDGCNENLVLTRPHHIEAIHESYLNAGCDIVETNTFGATPLVLAEYGLEAKAIEINLAATELARRAADRHSTKERPRFVAGSIGPTTKAMSVTGGVTFHELKDHFRIQAKALLDGGSDFLLLETCQDTRNVKAGLCAIDEVAKEVGYQPLVALSVTIEPMGTMLAGQSIEALLAAVEHRDLLYLGLNCATGPEFMTDAIRTLAQFASFPVACVPNAGLPDENGNYLETPEMVAQVLQRFQKAGWLNVVGGCCGTTPAHIAALNKILGREAPRTPKTIRRSVLSGVDFLEVSEDNRPLFVGERTNVIGSKKFKELITAEKFDEASDIAKAQMKAGAHVLDFCLANPDRDEMQDTCKFMEFAIKKVRAPIMIDSTDEKVVEVALTYSQGKAIINSINLEDGEERYEKIIPLVKQFGAAVVVGTIDDDPNQGMGVTVARKLEIAQRSFDLLTQKYGVPAEDIYWDPLVFPCATGDAQYVGSAKETIEAVKVLKEHFPGTKTVLGISNVSFGLPGSAREVLNSVFLYHCVQNGLDLAIVNTEKLERFADIPEEERTLADDLLFNRGADPVAAFAAHFRSKKPRAKKVDKNTLPLEERLSRYIVEGSKDGLVDDLVLALKQQAPLAIINGPLMKGMDEVGRLFNANQLIVAEVLQSAEAMKAAVAYLDQFMEKTESSTRGKVLLATVKGDVHDIGKNLVEIILANNGFHVVNLGIKIPPEQLIHAVREHAPDMIGLSGLLVKSAQQMVLTAEDMTRAGVMPPMLVGGAALSQNFVDKNISTAYGGTVMYAKDAMSGLDLAKTVVDKDGFEKLKGEMQERRAKLKAVAAPTETAPVMSERRSGKIQPAKDLPPPPDWERHLLRNTPVEQIWKFINPMMLYGRHLGVKGHLVRQIDGLAQATERARWEREEPKALAIWDAVEGLKRENAHAKYLQPRAVFRFFRAASQGNRILLHDPDRGAPFHFEFPRQRGVDGICLADYVQEVKPGTVPENYPDSIGLFVVTAGAGVRELAEKWKEQGEYLKSHILQALALETAEGYAEYLHAQFRKMWGFADEPEMTMLQRFQAKYRGKRYSFGYPACPRLDDQAGVFELLRPGEIGVELTEGFMMEPEASVSALVFHHPQAQYFSVGGAGDAEVPS